MRGKGATTFSAGILKRLAADTGPIVGAPWGPSTLPRPRPPADDHQRPPRPRRGSSIATAVHVSTWHTRSRRSSRGADRTCDRLDRSLRGADSSLTI